MIVRTKWEVLCELPSDKLTLEQVVQMILDGLDWSKTETFSKKKSNILVFRRSLIYFILISNHFKYTSVAKFANADHTTIIHNVRTFENQLDTIHHVAALLKETTDYINDNWKFYLEGSQEIRGKIVSL